jgi:hypothetical protein
MPERTSGATSLEKVSGEVMTSSPGLTAEQVHRQPERRGPRIDHHPQLLGQQFRTPTLELGDSRAKILEAAAAQHLEYRFYLALVVNRPCLGHPMWTPTSHLKVSPRRHCEFH